MQTLVLYLTTATRDVAWGNHHFVCGGSVQGGRVQGKYPDSLLEGSELDVGRGRIIPEFSWEVGFHNIFTCKCFHML